MKIDTYKATHSFDISKETLLLLGKQYRETEQVDHLTKTDVIQYTVSAIEYMTLDLLESSKGSSAKGIGEAMQMLDSISACAFVIKTKYTDIVGKLPNIAWEDLGLYARHSQYNPNFLSSLKSITKYELVQHALCSMLESGELEQIITTLHTMSPNGNDFPRMNALLGFMNDEYNAQYIESAIQNCIDSSALTSESGRARLLMSIVEIGEALNNSSAGLQSVFSTSMIDQLSIMRNAIAHPERVGNRDAINDFISNAAQVVINGIMIDLLQLHTDLIQSHAAIQDFLKLYDTSMTSDHLWQALESHSDDYVVTKKHTMPPSHHESILTGISKHCAAKLEEIAQKFIDDKKLLDEQITQQFKDRQFKDKIETKLKNPAKALEDITEVLKKYKAEYDHAKSIICTSHDLI